MGNSAPLMPNVVEGIKALQSGALERVKYFGKGGISITANPWNREEVEVR